MESTNPFEEPPELPVKNPFVRTESDLSRFTRMASQLSEDDNNSQPNSSTILHEDKDTPPIQIPPRKKNNPFLEIDTQARGHRRSHSDRGINPSSSGHLRSNSDRGINPSSSGSPSLSSISLSDNNPFSTNASPMSSGRTSPTSITSADDVFSTTSSKKLNEYTDAIPFYVNRLVTQIPSAALENESDYCDPFGAPVEKDYEKPFEIFARENMQTSIPPPRVVGPKPTAENIKARFDSFVAKKTQAGIVSGGGGGDGPDYVNENVNENLPLPGDDSYDMAMEIGGSPYQKIYPMSQLNVLPILEGVGRSEVEKAMQHAPAGAFLVRKQSNAETLVLSVIDGQKRFYHIKVLTKPGPNEANKFCVPPSAVYFNSLEDLVMHYTNEENNDALPCALTMHVNPERQIQTGPNGKTKSSTIDSALMEDMPEMFLERQSSLLVSTDYDSPRCLRCGQRLKGLLGKKRNLCQCCGVAVCNDCCSQKLAHSPNVRVCSMCYLVNKDSKDLRTKLRPVPVLVAAGNLTKADKNVRRWQERFFTLDSNGVFTYFKFRTKSKKRGTKIIKSTKPDNRPSDGDDPDVFAQLRSIEGGDDSSSSEIGAAVGAVNIMEGCTGIAITANANWPSDSQPMARFGVETKQRTYYFVAKDVSTAQRWIGVLTLTAACCNGCGQKVFSNGCKQCFAVTDRGILYHPQCYKCCDCERVESGNQVDEIPLKPLNLVDGKLCCGDHTIARRQAAKSLHRPMATIENMRCKLLPEESIQSHIAEGMQRYAQLALRATKSNPSQSPSTATPTDAASELMETLQQNVSMSALAHISDSTRLDMMNKVKRGEVSTEEALRILLHQATTAGERDALELARTAAFGIHTMMAEVTNPSSLQQGDKWITTPDSISGNLTLPNSVISGATLDKRASENYFALETVVHKPEAFRKIRKLSGISDEIYRDSFDPKKLGVENLIGGGSSGCWVMRTHDENCIIKAVRGTEKDVLLQIVDKYTDYIEKFPNTLLTRIVGIYDIRKGQGKYYTVLIMTNAMYNNHIHHDSDLHLDEVYDLKGSTVGRRSIKVGMETKENVMDSFSGTMKDLDLRRQFVLTPNDCDGIVKQLKEDSEFLKSLGLMDYSLIVALHNCSIAEWNQHSAKIQQHINSPTTNGWSNRLYIGDGLTENTKTIYVFGIIDLLQRWGTSKVAENFAKSRILRHDKHGISAVNPDDYAARFTTLLGGKFVGH